MKKYGVAKYIRLFFIEVYAYIQNFTNMDSVHKNDVLSLKYFSILWLLEVKDTTDTQKTASNPDLHRDIINGVILNTNLYDKRGDFTFPDINSNIQATPAYGVYISQFMQKDGQEVKHGTLVCLYIKITSKFYQEWRTYHFFKRFIYPNRKKKLSLTKNYI